MQFTRRDFLATTATGSALALAPLSLYGSAQDKDYIDSHVHVWTPDLKSYPISKNFKVSDMAPPSFTPEELLAHSKPNGVNRIVLVQMNFYEFDNRYMTDSMERFPGVFSGIGIVDHDQSNVVQEMRRLGKLGVRGFRLYADKPNTEGWSDSKGVRAMWSEGAESGQAMCLLANPDALPAIDRMCQAYPKTTVVVDHFARIGVASGPNSNDFDNLCKLARFENVHVKTSAFYALSQAKRPYTDMGPMIKRLLQEFGANRLMWGSDCPYQVNEGHDYASSIDLIANKLDFLSEEDKACLLKKTAEKIFF